jgi:hypothetical protein
MYGLHIYGVQIQDHQIPVICTYMFSSGETLTNATYINIIGICVGHQYTQTYTINVNKT